MIVLRDVHKRFGSQVVLDGVNLDVQEGETLALLGPSGTGKSVLLKHIIGLIRPDSGTVVVDDQHVGRLKRKELAELRSRIGYVFQNGALFDSMNVLENVRLGITDGDKYRDEDYARQRVAECLKLVNLAPEVMAKFPAELSGGMRKRVGIARAIAGSPKYLLYDEPTSGLDPVNADVIDSLVKRLDNELGVTSVMVTHDVRGAFRTADRLALLTGGKIVQQGTPGGVPEVAQSQGPGVPGARLPGRHFRRMSSDMDLSYKREVTVGSLVILAIVLFVVGSSWLKGSSIGADEDEFWKIQFKTAGNLKASSVVKISGVAVGTVERIRLADVGKVIVSVTLPDKIVPKVDATAQIVAVGFVGDAAIDFDPGDAAQSLTRDRIIIGSQAAGLTDLAQTLGDRADSVLLGAQHIVNKRTADELYATLTALQGTLKAAERTMGVYGDANKGPTAQLTRTMASLEQLTTRLDSTLANPALSRTLNRADTLTANLAEHDGAAHFHRRPARHACCSG